MEQESGLEQDFVAQKLIPVSGSTCNYPGLIALIFDVMAGEPWSLSTGSWSKISSFCSRMEYALGRL